MADGGIEIEKVEWLDPEMEFLASKRETGNEWELFKENVRPLKRGRKVAILNEALKAHNDNQLKMSLLDQRRFFYLFIIYFSSKPSSAFAFSIFLCLMSLFFFFFNL